MGDRGEMETADTGGVGSAGAPAAAMAIPAPSSFSSSTSTFSSSSSADATTTKICSQNAALAHEAFTLFQSRHYLECLQVLHQLLLHDRDNPKVIHNVALTEYFQDGCSDLQKLLDNLLKVKRRMEDSNVREKVEVVTQLNGPVCATSSSTNGGNTVSNEETPGSSLEDCDTSILLFNIAVILFHSQHFAAALSVLDSLRNNIEDVDEPVSLHMSLLMLDTALASDQLQKAVDILMYMERSGFIILPSETGANVLLPATLPSTSTADSATNTGTIAVAALSSPRSSAAVEASVFTRSSSEEVLDDDVLSLSLDMEGLNAAKPASSLMLSGMTERPPSAPPRDPNVKILLHVSKVWFYLCTRNIRAAKREIKLAMNVAQGGDRLKALVLLKAQLNFVRGNHWKAAKLLISSSREPGLKRFILNNLGCIHYCLQKDSIALHYLVNALKCSTPANSEKLPRLFTPSQSKSHSILYNIGLQQLRSGSPMLAARCFQAAGPSYRNQPLLWLRLAECCISALEKGLLEAGGCTNVVGKDKLRVTSVGEGKRRTLLLPNARSSLSNHTMLGGKGGSQLSFDGLDFFVPGWPQKLSLPFARHCLQNARHLISRSSKKASAIGNTEPTEDLPRDREALSTHTTQGSPSTNGLSKDGKISRTNTLLTSLTAFEENQAKRRAVLMQHILANLSFVEICLDNPVRALKSARELLKWSDCLMPLKFLGRLYAAEALCLLNRPKEAATELATCMLESTSVEIPVNGIEEDGQKWKSGENSEASGGEGDGVASASAINDPEITEALTISSLTGTRARAYLFVNLAMVHVMLGDISQAHDFAMRAVSTSPASPLAVLSLVYMHLVQGRTRDAVVLLKHCRHLCIVGGRQS